MRATQREALFFLLSVEEDFSIFSFPRGWEQHEELFFLLSVEEDFSILERELLESIRYFDSRDKGWKKEEKKTSAFDFHRWQNHFEWSRNYLLFPGKHLTERLNDKK